MSSATPSPMLAYYAARAAEYDAIYHKPERQADLRAIEAWLPRHLAGRRVLEIACGTGYWTQFIAPVAAKVVAIDAAPETLALARRRAGHDSVDFIEADAWRLPAALGRFDAAFAGFWFSHVPKTRRRAFLLGLHARLAPGARVVLLDNRFVAGSSTPVGTPDAAGDTWQQRRLADGSVHTVLKNFPEEAELQELVTGLGTHAAWSAWPHYWAFEYDVPDASREDASRVDAPAAIPATPPMADRDA
jgi:demethylmenaquinone methyltransferase/2-methoxy-6-polyprenyl-1,4-benzoquinol methylase